jgi:nucleoside-diphosphate-sugar epimerase
MSSRRVTVFGGTGFLGRRTVCHLLDADLAIRIASRCIEPEEGSTRPVCTQLHADRAEAVDSERR